MKCYSLALIAAGILLLAACNFSKGVKKNLSTGLEASYNGFAIDDVYLADAEGSPMPNNEVAMGRKVGVVVTGVDHFAAKDGKVFPGCRIVLTDKHGKEVLHLPDAFSDMAAGTPLEEARTLKASLNTGDPMQPGQTYHLSVRFFDKQEAANEIKADVDLQMIE